MSAMYQIEKLDENNFDSWSVQMRSVLVHAELWKIASGESPKPEADAEVVTWTAKDEKALAMITLSVKPSQLNYLKHCTTAADAWRRLKEVYQPSGPVRKVSLYKKLLNLKVSEGEKMAAYLNAFTTVIDKLAEVGIVLNDELVAIILLSSLPKEFENFVIAMETRDNLPTVEILKMKLLEESERRMCSDTHTKLEGSDQQAFAAKSAQGSEKKFKGKLSKNVICFRCGQRGHIKANCTTKLNEGSKQQKQYSFTVLAASNCNVFDRTKWCLDSGATAHMCCDRNLFSEFEQHTEVIALAGANIIYAEGRGSVTISTGLCTLTLNDVLYVPCMRGNFISVGRAVEMGCVVSFNKDDATVKKNGDDIMRIKQSSHLFLFEDKRSSCFGAMQNKAVIWHNRYGHLNYSSLNELTHKSLVKGMENVNFLEKPVCRTCMVCKIHTQPFPNSVKSRSKNLLDLVHTDVCGPFDTQSLGGSKYFLTFIDDMSRRIFVYFIKSKAEVFDKFVSFCTMVERQTGKRIKAVRSDNGREFSNKAFNDFFEKHGILRQFSVPYTPQQNGVAERANRTLVEMARSLLVHSGMPDSLWAEAVATAAYLRNRAPTRALNNVTPYEAWCGKKPSVHHLKVFGAVAVALDKTHLRKFQQKGRQYIMVGYSLVSKAYRLYDAGLRQVVEKRDVLFDEASYVGGGSNKILFDFEHKQQFQSKTNNNDDNFDDTREEVNEKYSSSESGANENDDGGREISSENDEFLSADEQQVKHGPGRPKLVRSGKPGRPKKQFNVLNAMNTNEVEVPQSYEAAMASKQAALWKIAMEREHEALTANQTWSLVDVPKGQSVIGCKWVYSIKRDKHGNIERYKARLVAKGCSQKFGVNYVDTFSPVCRFETIRLLLALAVELKMYVHQMDVCTAYLNSELSDVVYMRQPKGYCSGSKEEKALRLNKAIYGLKQSGREWNSKLDATLRELGFIQCESERCLYKKDVEGNLCLILVYVDDLLIACQSKEVLNKVKRDVCEKFECVDKGSVHMFLGMQIERDGELGEISVGQSQYIKDLLRHHRIGSCRPASTPLDAGFQVACDNKNCKRVDETTYQSIIGALMWLALSTRPDIFHSVAKLAQRNKDPHSEHLAGIMHVLRYLAATIDMKLHYLACKEPLKGYADADWGGDRIDRRSYTGYVFFLAGCPISWKSEKQDCVALSSTEAEYLSMSSAAKEALHLRRIIIEIGCGDASTSTVLFGDNLSAQHLAKNPVHHARTKHIDIRYHFVRDVVEKGDIKLEYVSTNEMIADVLTKNLPKQKHNEFLKLLSLK